MPAYFGPWRLIAAEPVPPELVALARKLVGSMLEVGGIPQRQWNLPGGGSIHALLVNGMPKVTFTQAPSAAAEEGTFSDLWVPRGLVVYPAFHAAPMGYGLPIVADTTAGPYDKANLAPGLAVARWTAGGPCGEVLVSPDPEAGYPTSTQAITVPLLYHPTLGPTFHWGGEGFYDQRAVKDAWKSYRLALAAPVANYSDENVASSLALFEAINTYRTGAALPALNLLPRGYYRPAKVMASIMLTNGSTAATNPGYPATYQTEDDRLTKDGFSAEVTGVPFTTFNRGDHPTAYELRQLGGDAAAALAAWQGVPADDAVLRKDVGRAGFADIGYRGGYWCADVIERTRWIEAGNLSWQGADESLPPISWHGFASLNLAWETYPATYDPANYTTAPLVPVRSFTDGNGDCWLRYPRNTAPTPADKEPALGRHIYCRGRAIALAPRGGLVWSAGVVALQGKDRLLALVHHPDEQPADYTHEGFTRYLRVWWCDVPTRAHLRLDPPTTICGIASGDAYAWQGGQQIDLGMMPAPAAGFTASTGINSLKYASQWRFALDGRKAICLRDYGAFGDYRALGDNRVLWSAALNARAVELSFDALTDSTAATVTFHDYTAGATAPDRLLAGNTPPGTQDAFDITMFEAGAVPVAVDYDKFTGKVTYAYSARVTAHQTSSWVDPAGASSFVDYATYTYLGVGGASVQYASDLTYRVLHGARFQTPHTDAVNELALVLDVRTASFAAKVTRPRFAVDPAAALTLTALARPCQTFTSDLVDGVRLFRQGVQAREDFYPCPDGALYTVNDRCFTSLADSNELLVFLPLAASANLQGFHAQRFDQVVLGYQCAPVPRATLMLASAPSSAACDCRLTNAAITGAHWMTDAEQAPRGGAVGASVPLPANDWLIYAKVV